MPISGSSGNESIVVEAYSYVLEMRARYNETNGEEGAFIVATNSSFGVDYGNPDDYPIWCAMYDEMGDVGILSCGAGPNMNVNVDVVGDVPSACPGEYLIGITNTTSADIKYGGAGYGVNNIDIGAPGTSIYSTTPNSNYGNSTGTSMATPQVSGTIALMYAALSEDMMQACKSDPANFSLAMRQHLLNGADHLSSLDGLVAEGRRLNAYGAIYDFINNWRPTQIVEMKMEEFLVYPNPAKGYITIEGTGTVTVINALGQTVLTKEIDGKAKVELPQGLYFVTLGGETRKIVVE